MPRLALAAAAVLAALPAHAVTTIVTTPSFTTLPGEGFATARPLATEERFNTAGSPTVCAAPNPANIDIVGGLNDDYRLANNSVVNQRRAPSGDTSCYLTLGAARYDSTIEITFVGASASSPLSYLGFHWGSVDPWNHVVFKDANGVPVDFAGGIGPDLDGQTLSTAMGLPLTSDPWVEFEFDDADAVTTLVLSVSNYAFELDNLAWIISPAPFGTPFATPFAAPLAPPLAAALLATVAEPGTTVPLFAVAVAALLSRRRAARSRLPRRVQSGATA